MDYYVGIDVSLELSSLCVLDATGRIVREAKLASEPQALIGFLSGLALPLARIGLEAGPLSQWLHAALVQAGFAAAAVGGGPAHAAGRGPRSGGFCGGAAGDAPRQGSALGHDRQDRPARCTRHRPAPADGLVPVRALQVAAGPGGAGAPGRTQAAADQDAGCGAQPARL